MSIFKETIPAFIQDQLSIREAAIIRGNNIDETADDLGHEFAGMIENSRFSSQRITLQGSQERIILPAGSYFTTTVNKQCTIRMCSGVDVKSGTFPNYPSEPTGVDLAKLFTLQGGTYSFGINPSATSTNAEDAAFEESLGDNLADFESLQGQDIDIAGRFGIGGAGAAYGDKNIRSHAHDGFGIVPMPGIVDANIRVKTAYGSLRDAKINFVCHNRGQLEVLELLYMRPGYPVLLEWGWSPYISNRGKITKIFPSVATDDLWFNKNKTLDQINNEIITRKKEAGGNYDAMTGIVKNFEINARPDGGYDCSTELISRGEVLEGLKGSIIEDDKVGYRTEDSKDKAITLFLKILKAFEDYSTTSAIFSENEEGVFDPILFKVAKDLLSKEIDREEGQADPTLDDTETEKDILTQFKLEDIYSGLIIKPDNGIVPITGVGTSDEEGRSFARVSMIRWDLLVEIFNYYIVPKVKDYDTSNKKKIFDENGNNVNSKKHEPEPLTKFTVYESNPNQTFSTNKYLTYTHVQFPANFKLLWRDASSEEANEVDSGRLLGSSLNKQVCLLPHQFELKRYLPNYEVIDFRKKYVGVSKARVNQRSIGNIFININYLINLYLDMFYDKNGLVKADFNFLEYFKRVWEQDISKATANQHNFVLNADPIKNTDFRVIDYDIQINDSISDQQFSSNSFLKIDDLYEFKIQGNKSIVRSFQYNSSIPSDMASMISIAAQAPDSISSLDEISFAAFNKNIKSRFTIIPEKTQDQRKETWKDNLQLLNTDIQDLRDYFLLLFRDYSVLDDDEKQRFRSVTEQEAHDILTRLDTTIYKLTSVDFQERQVTNAETQETETIPPTYNKLDNPPIPAKSAVIPLRFSARIDGISGLVIGNVFKVERDKLPKGYQGRDIGFIITSENQTITSGQDWTTDFTGQLIILDTVKERVHLNPNEVGSAGEIEIILQEIDYDMEELDRQWRQKQSTEADYWTTVAITVMEHGNSSKYGVKESQGMADVAVSIFNRFENGNYFSGQGDEFPEVKTIKSIIIAPAMDRNNNGSPDYTGTGAYQPTYYDGSDIAVNKASTNNKAWCLIEDYDTALEAVIEASVNRTLRDGGLDMNDEDVEAKKRQRRNQAGYREDGRSIRRLKSRLAAAVRGLDPDGEYLTNARKANKETAGPDRAPSTGLGDAQGVGRRTDFRALQRQAIGNGATELMIFERKPVKPNNCFFPNRGDRRKINNGDFSPLLRTGADMPESMKAYAREQVSRFTSS